MQDKTKKYLVGIITPAVILIGGLALGQITVETVKYAGGFLVGGTAIYFIAKRIKLGEWRKQWEEELNETQVSRSIGLDEAMESLKEWSRDHYVGDQEMSFRWDSTIYKTTVEKDPDTGDEYMFYAFVTLGENNRYVLVCVEGKNGEIVEYQPVLYEGMLKDPFSYVEMVRELRKNKFRTRRDDLDQFPGGQQSNWRSVYQSRGGGAPIQRGGGGLALDNSIQQQQPALQDDTEGASNEAGDEE